MISFARVVSVEGGKIVERVDPSEREALVSELAKLIEIIQDSPQRRTFLEDPRGTLEKHGVDLDVVPEKVLDTLGGLSYEELGVVVKVCEDFAEAGLTLGEFERGGRVCFF